MISFIIIIALVSLIFFGLFFIIKNKIVWKYRGVLFIFLSCLYFTVIFYTTKLMQESFK